MSFDLAKALKELQEQEKTMEKLYSELLKENNDEEVVKGLRSIRREGRKHLKLVQELINHDEKMKSPEVFSKVEPAEEIVLNQGATNLLVTKPANWFPGVLSVLKALEGKQIAYVALNKSADTLKSKIKEAGISLDGVKFVGTSKKNFMGKSEEASKNLPTICKAVSDAKKPIVIFDHVASLANYNPLESLACFIKSMTEAAAQEGFVVIFVTTEKPAQKLLIELMKSLIHNTIKTKKAPIV